MTFSSRGGIVMLAGGLLVLAGLAGGASAQGGRARSGVSRLSGTLASPRIAVVMESSAGDGPAKRVRGLMAKHLGLAVGGLDSLMGRGGAQRAGQRVAPDAVVAIMATGTRNISVHYWDRTGRTDLLTAPLPKGVEQMSLVSASLAVAVVRKHVQDLRDALLAWGPTAGSRGTAQAYGVPTVPPEVRRFFGRMAAIRHRTELLTEADF